MARRRISRHGKRAKGSTTLSVSLAKALKRLVAITAKADGRTTSGWVVRVLERAVGEAGHQDLSASSAAESRSFSRKAAQ